MFHGHFICKNAGTKYDSHPRNPDICPKEGITLQGINISPKNGILKMIFLFPRWDMLIPWRVKLKSYYFSDGIGTLNPTVGTGLDS